MPVQPAPGVSMSSQAELAIFFSISNFGFLQPLNLERYTESYLKDLIYIFLESEAQGCGIFFLQMSCWLKMTLFHITQSQMGVSFLPRL